MIPSTRLYELKTYQAADGKLEQLVDRFRHHTIRLLAKHGMRLEGFWLPAGGADGQLVYLLSHTGEAARQQAWEAFGADEEWQAVKAATNQNGSLTTSMETLMLTPTDFSPLR